MFKTLGVRMPLRYRTEINFEDKGYQAFVEVFQAVVSVLFLPAFLHAKRYGNPPIGQVSGEYPDPAQ